MNVRKIYLKIPTYILIFVVCLGMTSHCVRAVATFSESETEKVDPQEEKKLFQRFSLSRISRHIHIRNVVPFLINSGECELIETFVYQKPAIYQRDHKIPILRAPPSTDISA
jgi:hypothetical protein